MCKIPEVRRDMVNTKSLQETIIIGKAREGGNMQ